MIEDEMIEQANRLAVLELVMKYHGFNNSGHVRTAGDIVAEAEELLKFVESTKS